MEFGSQQVFDYIKYNLAHAENELWYNRLYAVIEGDVKGILYSYGLQEADKDDIIQEIQLNVIKGLVKFVYDSEDNTKEQRNAWLRKIARNSISDFFRKKYRKVEELVDEYPEIPRGFSYNDENEKNFQKEVTKEKALNALKVLFSINTSPEKIIAFVFNRIIGTAESSRKNGPPKEIVEKYGGIKIEAMFKIMKEELNDLVDFEIPPDVYLPLANKIDEITQQGKVDILFTLSPRGITDSSNWITKKMKEKEEEDDE